MYSTNLHLSEGDGTFIWDDTRPVGTAFAFGNENGKPAHVGPPTQTAKDNALLWSLAPEMVELLIKEWEAYPSRSSTDPNKDEWLDQVGELLAKLAQAIPSIDEALHA